MGQDSKLRISLRGRVLAEAAPVTERDGEVFVQIDSPPPARAVLEVHDGSSSRHLQVVRVVESSDAGRGFFGRYMDDVEERGVGTEHLTRLAPDVVEQLVHSDSGPEEMPVAASYPVPAPVLEAEPSEPIDLREHEGAPKPPRGKKRKGRKRG